jgi:hypothetical protein
MISIPGLTSRREGCARKVRVMKLQKQIDALARVIQFPGPAMPVSSSINILTGTILSTREAFVPTV